MFTIKYRTFEHVYEAATPEAIAEFEKQANLAGQDHRHHPDYPRGRTIGFSECDRIDGPYGSVSSRYEGGYLTIFATRGDFNPGMTYGPVLSPEPRAGDPPSAPRPTLWVMNESGATIAKYDL